MIRVLGAGHLPVYDEGAEALFWVVGGIILKKQAILVALTLCVVLMGCNQQNVSQGGESSKGSANTASVEEAAGQAPATDRAADPSPATDQSAGSVPSTDQAADSATVQSTDPAPTTDQAASLTPGTDQAASPVPATDQVADPAPAEAEQTTVLYIGTKANGFAEYPMVYQGELTPEMLIQGIADLTGWNLTLAEPVVFGKGGMSVCLANESALFTGPPNPQNEEFHMFSAEQIAETILDSIQKTLQNGFVLEPGDPNTLDIWYYMEGQQPLELSNVGLSWSIDQPYQWVEAEITQQ